MPETKQYYCPKCKLTPWLTEPRYCICGGGMLKPVGAAVADTLEDVFGESFGSIFRDRKDK